MLLEDMADQQLKEIVIAYTMLFMAGADEGGGSLHDRDAGLTEAQLDRRCEDFLVEHFGLKVRHKWLLVSSVPVEMFMSCVGRWPER